jgi:hypothetical protein
VAVCPAVDKPGQPELTEATHKLVPVARNMSVVEVHNTPVAALQAALLHGDADNIREKYRLFG